MNTPVNLGAHLSCPFLRDPVYWWPRHEVWQGAVNLQKHSAPRTLLWQVQPHGVRYLSWRETQKDMSNLPVYSQLFLPSHQSCQAHGILASSRLGRSLSFFYCFYILLRNNSIWPTLCLVFLRPQRHLCETHLCPHVTRSSRSSCPWEKFSEG